MKKNILILIVAILAVFYGNLLSSQQEKNASAENKSEDAKIAEAKDAAELWLNLLDNEKYDETWNNASTFFKEIVPKKNWLKDISKIKKIFGKLKSRKLIGTKYLTSIPGGPDGEYVTLIYQSDFDNKKNAIETITPMLDKDSWRVAGYYIK
ncbi:MAG TPA: DUF4019 domain-containing protein [Victivallales bacterium]|nr:DUF4019 domain-containing protein [Victivallales bacterium]HRR06526.1 DUF4019 domain-containing protein [Victivallales bacterium]HRR29352.1 DUF4019 domain-containing protein [Victivallales bacterium]HRU02286.1 DUF4019 domain-containing protein [Victivallales bacterium]